RSTLALHDALPIFPLGQALTALDLVAVVHQQFGAVGNALRRTLDATFVQDGDCHVATHRDQSTFRIAKDVAVLDLDRTLVGGFQERLVDHGRGTTKVEGTHGKLRARLADRLSSDDANGLAHVDGRTACKVAAVADRANAGLNFAGQS